MSEEEMKEEMKAFSINIDDIQPNYEPFEEIRKAIAIIRQEYLIENVEVILNGNLLMSKNKLNNYRTIFGARVSLENLDKDVSFIVREDTQPSYEEIQTENTKLKQDKQELIKWLEEEIKNASDKSNSISNLTNISYGSRSYALEEVLERLVGEQ